MSSSTATNSKEPAPKKPTLSLDEWTQRLSQVHISKAELDKLVMNYLVIEGYKDAAEQFSIESHIRPPVDLSAISDRMSIRHSIQSGQVEQAMERVNDLDPEVLDTNPKLYFRLMQQRLIELIRGGRIEEALEFAQEELAPRGEENPEFLEELEKTMALLAFEDGLGSPFGYLLDHGQRQKTAGELNSALLMSQCVEKDPKLPLVLKMLVWAQTQLGEKANFPRIKNWTTAELIDPDADNAMQV